MQMARCYLLSKTDRKGRERSVIWKLSRLSCWVEDEEDGEINAVAYQGDTEGLYLSMN